MKYLFYFLIFLMCNTLFSQDYRFFPESKAIWNETHTYLPECGTIFPCNKAQLIQDGDTVIGTLNYNKIYASGEQIIDWNRTDPFFPIAIYEYYNDGYIGGIRQDSINRKIFFLPKNSDKDTLLYDFNLSIGDTVPITYINNLVDTIAEIDSIELTNGVYAKRYHPAKLGYGNMYLIEGIGSTLGLLTQFYWGFEELDNLTCFSQDDNWIYPKNTACEIYTRIENVYITTQYNFLYENKYRRISYESFDKEISRLTIYDINGVIVLNTRPNKRTFSVNVDFDIGIYFSSIMFNNDEYLIDKFLIH